MKKNIIVFIAVMMLVFSLTGCEGKITDEISTEISDVSAEVSTEPSEASITQNMKTISENAFDKWKSLGSHPYFVDTSVLKTIDVSNLYSNYLSYTGIDISSFHIDELGGIWMPTNDVDTFIQTYFDIDPLPFHTTLDEHGYYSEENGYRYESVIPPLPDESILLTCEENENGTYLMKVKYIYNLPPEFYGGEDLVSILIYQIAFRLDGDNIYFVQSIVQEL